MILDLQQLVLMSSSQVIVYNADEFKYFCYSQTLSTTTFTATLKVAEII